MQDTAEHIEEVAEAQAPTAEDVKAFLREEAEKKEAAEAETTEVEEEKEPEIKEVDMGSEGIFTQSFSSDVTFERDEAEAVVRQYMAPVQDEQVPITDADQAMYLKSVLNDVPLRLTQTLANGMISVECRALSIYEQDLVVAAALKMAGIKTSTEESSAVLSLLPSMAQQIRIVMQVTRINNAAQDYIHLEAKSEKQDRDEQINQLVHQVYSCMERMQTSKFGFLVRAVNVFEHKLAKMNSLAFNKTFWKPVEIG